MAIGFIPKFENVIQLNDLSSEQYLAIARQAVTTLGWDVAYLSPTGLIAYTGSSAFRANSEVRLILENSEAKLVSKSLGNEMIDFGRNRKFINAFIQQFNETRLLLTGEQLDALVAELNTTINTDEEGLLAQPQPATFQSIKSFLYFFVPQPGYVVTPLIIDINFLMFLLMALTGVSIITPDADSLITWGASFKPLVLEGQVWRLFTNIFLHIGLFHLLFNMYALAYIGLLLEHRLGTLKFAVAYVATGIAASMVSVCWHSFTVSAGASGAIFGLYGVFLALLTGNFINKNTRQALLTSITVFVGYNLLYGLKDGVDNAAHIGGLLSGLLIGYAYIPSLKNPADKTLGYATAGTITAAIIIASFIAIGGSTDDIGSYQSKMNNFATTESMALEVYSLPDTTSKEDILYEIKNRGIYYWNENMALVKEADKLSLPETLHERNKKLLSYCQLRIKSYNLMYKAVAENTNAYKKEIEFCDSEINNTINDLKSEANPGN